MYNKEKTFAFLKAIFF